MILPATCVLTVTCIFWAFLEYSNMSNSFLIEVIRWFSVRFLSEVTPSSLHSHCLFSRMWLQQILNCSSWSSCWIDIWLVVISINVYFINVKHRINLLWPFWNQGDIIFKLFNTLVFFPLVCNYDKSLNYMHTAYNSCLVWW